MEKNRKVRKSEPFPISPGNERERAGRVRWSVYIYHNDVKYVLEFLNYFFL